MKIKLFFQIIKQAFLLTSRKGFEGIRETADSLRDMKKKGVKNDG